MRDKGRAKITIRDKIAVAGMVWNTIGDVIWVMRGGNGGLVGTWTSRYVYCRR